MEGRSARFLSTLRRSLYLIKNNKKHLSIRVGAFIIYRVGVCMKISDRINKNTRNKLKKLSSNKSKKKSVKKTEKLSDYDLAELMGVRRDRYERRGGAVRRK